MTIESRGGAAVPVPRTAVPLGITDPVKKARAELKAALAAIEEKANVPKRVGRETDRLIAEGRRYARENPIGAIAAVAGAAVGIGVIVWGAVRLYVR